jgi:ABC-2 type transport system ATP-binding protein
VRADGLSRSFDGVAAVDRLDLEVAPGEIYGFLGPNGAGKTTTLRMLCTLLAPTGGSATVAGHDVANRPDLVRLRIGVALQEAALDPRQTGTELLRLQGRLYGLSRAEVAGRLEQLRALVDIGEALDRPIATYSGGMKRRLDLAAALIHNPDVLFLDEPTTGLDPMSRAKVWAEVRELNHHLGTTIFLTTQYLEEADALADRVGILHGGRLVAEGAPDALKHAIGDDVIVVRVHGDAADARRALDGVEGVQDVDARADELVIAVKEGPSAIGPVAVALHARGVAVRDLEMRRPTLDDVFLELTGSHIRRRDDRLDTDDHDGASADEPQEVLR